MNLIYPSMLIILVIGILLVLTVFWSNNKLKSSECEDIQLINDLRTCLILGTILSIIPLSYIICKMGCKNSSSIDVNVTNMSVLCIFMLAISIVMMIYSVRIQNGLKRCNIVNMKGLPFGLLITSIIIMVMSITVMGMLIYNKRQVIENIIKDKKLKYSKK